MRPGREYLSFLDLDFDLLLGHCSFVQSVLTDEQSKVRAWYADATKRLDEEQKAVFFERHGDEQYYVNDAFPSIQWSAMFVMAFNLFEKTLNEICLISGSIPGVDISLKDLAGKGIHRSHVFLSKCKGVTAPFSSEEWRRIQNYSKVRNVLAHTYGDLDLSNRSHNEVLEIAKRSSGSCIVREDESSCTAQIVVEEQFVLAAITDYRAMIRRLTDAVERTGIQVV